jgi:hypothetical protein
MNAWAEQHAPNPSDLIYSRDPDTGEVFTDRMWTVLEVETPVPAEKLAPSMPWKTYWPTWVQCDDGCAGRCIYGDNSRHIEHCLLLSADDFVLVSRLPEFEVQR